MTTDILLRGLRWEKLVRELMLEVIATANALGFDVLQSLAEENINRTRIMGAYKASTLIDFERRQPLELESMFLEPLRRAQQAGVPTPRLASRSTVSIESVKLNNKARLLSFIRVHPYPSWLN